MIKNILDMLQQLDAYNVCEEIEIAKGKYAIPRTVRETFNQIKREFKYGKK